MPIHLWCCVMTFIHSSLTACGLQWRDWGILFALVLFLRIITLYAITYRISISR
eukprot:m.413353 g.413353  ORF g.413353 m.413353 type:complete len:54 (-) comp20172_c7_seq13:179-340(-)